MQQVYVQLIDLSKKLIGPSCTRQLLEKGDWSNVACLKIAASKGLGLGIVLGSALVKLPQIYKIISAGNADGVSFLSQFLELIAASINAAYNFKASNPFTTYGEKLMISVQNAVIVALIGFYTGQLSITLLISVVYAALITALISPKSGLGMKELGHLQMISIPLVALSRLPQLWQLISEKKVGQLSQVTVWLLSLGSLARVFTCLQEVRGDKIVLIANVVYAALNCIIALLVSLISFGIIKSSKSIGSRRTSKHQYGTRQKKKIN
jgi:mannose-P-dolichol utilization defect 1